MNLKRKLFQQIAKLNKKLLPNYTKSDFDLRKASKLQMAIVGWKLWVTKNAVNQ